MNDNKSTEQLQSTAPGMYYTACSTLADCTHETNNEEQKIKNAKRGNFKICCTCKKEYPKTEEYFFKKVTKWKLSDGSLKEYFSFRSDCIKCHGKKGYKITKLKRFAELNCSEDTYKSAWIKERSFKKTKYKELIGIPKSKANYIRKKIDKGYVFTSIEQWDKDVKNNYRRAQLNSRKYNYKNKGILSSSERNEVQMNEISKAIICNRLKIKTEELPDEVYKNIKLTIQLKRELGLTHSSIAQRNINSKYQEKWKQNEI